MILLKTIVLWKMNGDNFSYLLMFYQCGTVFQTAFLTACYNPETSSRVTLASLSIGFQPKLIRCLWIKYQYIKIQKYIFLCFFLIFIYWYFICSVFICLVLSSRQVSSSCFNPETSSRVTLASLGIGFQPKVRSVESVVEWKALRSCVCFFSLEHGSGG